MEHIGLIFVAGLGLLHLYARRLQWVEGLPTRQWFSFGAGVSLAYVFVDVLPLLSHSQHLLDSQPDSTLQRIPHAIFVIGLFGLAAFYSLEILALRSRQENLGLDREDCTSPTVFWLHIGAFSLYNALLGYLLSEAEHQGVLPCALLFFALLLHFQVNDHALRAHHKSLHDRFGRRMLALAVVGGYLLGSGYPVGEMVIAILWAFVAGALVLNVIKDELPRHSESSLGAFLVGSVGYAGVLLVVAH